MAICDPNANPPGLPGVRAMAPGELKPEMRTWILPFANDTSIPIGTTYRRWFGDLPVVARVLCHSYTVTANGTQVPGAYHGVTLFVATDLATMPPKPGSVSPVGAAAGGATDWVAVSFAGAAIVLTVGGFLWMLKAADRRKRS